MINWKELEKFIAPGKVMTLVIMVDGKEVGALSFNVDSLAYKEALEVKSSEPVKIAEKSSVSAEIKKAEDARKESLKAKKATTTKLVDAKLEPMPMDDEEEEKEETEKIEVDETTGEVIENKELPDFQPLPWKKEEEASKKLTRAEIMAEIAENNTNAEKLWDKHKAKEIIDTVNSDIKAKTPEPKKKIVEQTFGEEW